MLKRGTKVIAHSATGHEMPGRVIREQATLPGWYVVKGPFHGSVHESMLRSVDNRPGHDNPNFIPFNGATR